MSYEPEFVRQFYVMDPTTEDILFSGSEIEVGMEILLESPVLRKNPDRGGEWTDYDRALVWERNRWCQVLRKKVHMSNSGPMISFLALYENGQILKRSYTTDHAWYVKKNTIPMKTEDVA